ncbi:MAG: T9SS type A sorting domain-containing protein, partial [Bacteroidota bacterium]
EHVEVVLFDASGRRVRLLTDGYLPAGTHRVDILADELSAGLYFIRVIGADWTAVQSLSVNR